MPSVAPRPCLEPGCSQLVQSGRCPEHAKSSPARQYEERRGSFRERGYTRPRWDKRLRPQHLAVEPFCRTCHFGEGRPGTPGNVVDHVIPHRGADWLFELPANLQTLCVPCHNAKSGREAHTDLDALWPLDLPEPARPVRVLCGPSDADLLAHAREHGGPGGEIVPRPKHKARGLYAERNDALRSALVEETAAELWVVVHAPRTAERAFWSHVLGVEVEIITGERTDSPWWHTYDADRAALEAIARRHPKRGSGWLG